MKQWTQVHERTIDLRGKTKKGKTTVKVNSHYIKQILQSLF